jgi:lipopolysaccharide export system ATP-binding protein
MRTRQDVLEFLRRLEAYDLSVGVGIRELFALADEEGKVALGTWFTSVKDAFGSMRGRGDGTGSTLPEEEEVLRQYLREQVLARLEGVGIARRDTMAAGEGSLQVVPEVWEEVSADRAAFLEAVGEAVEASRRKGQEGVDPSATVLPEGSHLYAEGLTKIYRKRKVVNEVGLSVRQGEIVGLLGPNGAGKTTTFYMIVGLIPPNAGRVFLDDKEITEVPMYKRSRLGVGYLAQEPSVFRKLTVEENVLAILETLKISRRERKERLEGLLNELSIAHLRKNKAYSLSGGERRRLEITRALVQRPKFMLLDEPFAGIDPIAVNDIQQIVHGLKGRGIGAVISDHNVEQTLEIVDRAYIMYEGRIRVSGTVSELVWNDEVAEIYFGPTLTARMRARYPQPVATA